MAAQEGAAQGNETSAERDSASRQQGAADVNRGGPPAQQHTVTEQGATSAQGGSVGRATPDTAHAGQVAVATRPGPALLSFSAVPALLAFVIAGVFLLNSGDISGPEATYPIVLGVTVLIVGAVNLVRDLLTAARAEQAQDGDGESAAGLSTQAVLRLIAFVVVLIAALLLLEPLGFFPAMVVMTIGALLCFDVRSPLVIAAATALIVGTSYLIFVRFLLVPFPPGFLGLT